MICKMSLLRSTPWELSTSATVAAVLTFRSHVTQPGQHSADHSTARVTAENGATDGAVMIRILLTTAVSTRSGNYPLASSAAVTSARVVFVSASEDIKTTDTMDDDTDDALECLDEDNCD